MATPPLNEPWEFPGFALWSIPLCLTVGLWFLLLVEHLFYLNDEAEGWEIRFQALYVRIVSVFPIFAGLAFAGACFPWLTHWFELAGVFLEAYVLFGFYAFLTGIAFVKSPLDTFPNNLLDSHWTNRAFSIVQFLIVKPTILLIMAVYVQRNGHEPEQRVKVLMNLISAVSIIFATIAVLRLYKGLSIQPDSVMKGHNGLMKIAVVKLLFMFIVLNNLVLRNLAANDSLPIPSNACTDAVKAASATNLDYCEARTINIVFLLEVLICVIPAVISYRHHGLGLKRELALCKTNAVYFIVLVVLRPFDLGTFWNNRLPKATKPSTSQSSFQSISSTDKAAPFAAYAVAADNNDRV